MTTSLRSKGALCLAVVLLGCGPERGGLRQPCLPGDACESGLSCVSDVCVQVIVNGSGGGVGGAAGAAGMPMGGGAGGIAGNAGMGGAAGAGVDACMGVSCEAGTECLAGRCVLAYSSLRVSEPASAGPYGAGSRIPLVANITLASGFSGVNPPMALRYEAVGLDGGALPRFGGDYATTLTVSPGTPSGNYVLTVVLATDAGSLSAGKPITIDTTPPQLSLQWAMDGGAARRDEVAVGLVTADEAVTNLAIELADAGAGSVVLAQTSTCTTAGLACSGAWCQCVTVDALALPVNGLEATYALTLSGKDALGNSRTDGGASLKVTRKAWVANDTVMSGTVSATPPVIDRDGNVYSHFRNGVRSYTPMGEMRGVLAGVEPGAYLAIGKFDQAEVLYADTRGYSTSALVRMGGIGCGIPSDTGPAQAPVVLPVDGGTTALAIAYGGRLFPSLPVAPSRYCYTTLRHAGYTDGLDGFNQAISPITGLTPNLTAYGRSVHVLVSLPIGGVTVGTYADGMTNTNPLFVPTSQQLGPASGLVRMSSTAFLASGTETWSGPYASGGWTVAQSMNASAPPAVLSTTVAYAGRGVQLMQFNPSAPSLPVTVMHTGNARIATTPVIGRARNGNGRGQLFAVNEAAEVMVFDANGRFTYDIKLGYGKPMHATLDCNRVRPGSGTGILYVALNSGALAALVVDAPGLAPQALWPKFQRTASNSGNLDPSFELNPGCPSAD